MNEPELSRSGSNCVDGGAAAFSTGCSRMPHAVEVWKFYEHLLPSTAEGIEVALVDESCAAKLL